MFKAEDVLAVKYLAVLHTRWWQFRKRKKLFKEAERYRKQVGIKLN